MEVDEILTIHEVAEFLRLDESSAEGLIKSGDLAALRIAGQWRIRAVDLVGFLERRLEDERLRSLARILTDSRVWARELDKNPALKKSVQETEYPPDTFGAFLKGGLASLEAEADAGNVIPFEPDRRKRT